jgi:TRAP transporter 4TM/12TM fusion protein
MMEKDPAESRYRHYSGWMGKLVKTICVGLVLYSVAFVLGVFEWVGIYLVMPSHNALHLGTILFLCFLLVPATKTSPRGRLPWYDACLALLAIPWNIYMLVFFNTIDLQVAQGYTPLWNQIFIWITLIITMEACRRSVGWYFSLLLLFFIFYAFFANYFPSFLHGAGSRPDQLVRYIGTGSEGLYSGLLGISATIIISFIFFGAILNATGGGQFIIDFSLGLFGHLRGGPAKVATIASGLFGMLSGSSLANVATTGVITIPLMKKAGYKAEFAGAVETVAGSGGHIMPPVMGAAIFVMCQFLNMPYREAIIASALPAVLYYIGVFSMVDLEARKEGLYGIPRAALPSAKRALATGWFYLTPIFSLIFMLFVLLYSPQKSAIYATILLLLIVLIFRRRQINIKNLVDGMISTSTSIIAVSPFLALAGVVGGCISITGVGFRLTGGLIDLVGGHLFLLVPLTAILGIIMGMGLPIVPIYVTLAILLAPALIELGVLPIAAHLFIAWIAVTSMITPPVAPVAYVASVIAGSDFIRTGILSCRLGIVAFLAPLTFVFQPQLLLIGSLNEVILAVVTAVIGIILLSIGLQGYLLTHTSWWQRILFIFSGIMLFIPGWTTTIIGVPVAVISIFLHWRLRKVQVKEFAAGVESVEQSMRQGIRAEDSFKTNRYNE